MELCCKSQRRGATPDGSPILLGWLLLAVSWPNQFYISQARAFLPGDCSVALYHPHWLEGYGLTGRKCFFVVMLHILQTQLLGLFTHTRLHCFPAERRNSEPPVINGKFPLVSAGERFQKRNTHLVYLYGHYYYVILAGYALLYIYACIYIKYTYINHLSAIYSRLLFFPSINSL